MFGSNPPFGQSSSDPSGSSSALALNSNASNGLFCSKPFGSISPFGSSTGLSVLGGNSNAVFGGNSLTSGSTSSFGAPSSLASGSSKSAFGAPSTPAFGSSSCSFGASSFIFEHEPAFEGFASSLNQFGSSGSSFQQIQNTFGSTPFGLFTPVGASITSSCLASSSTFGDTCAASNTFGTSNTSAFATPAFEPSSNFTTETQSTSGFEFGTSHRPWSSASASDSSRSTLIFGARSSSFGRSITTLPIYFAESRTRTPTFDSMSPGTSVFGGWHGGSRITAYTPTIEVDGSSGTATSARLLSLSSMTLYKDKSHEELRWEDYQTGDKGGIGVGGSTTRSNFFSPSSTVLHSSKNPLSSTTSSNPFGSVTTNLNLFYPTPISQPSVSQNLSNPFALKTTDLGFTTSVASYFPCSRTSSSANNFKTTSSTPSSVLTVSSSLFGSNNSPTFLRSTSALGTTSGFNSGFSTSSTQLSSVFKPSFGPTTAPSFSQPTIVAPSTRSGLGGNSSTYQATKSHCFPYMQPSFAFPFHLQATKTVQTSGAFATTIFPQSLAGKYDVLNLFISLCRSTTQSTAEVQLQPMVGTFGVLPAMSQLSISLSGSTPTTRCGISSMPVSYKPASPVRLSSYLTCRHVSQRRTRLPARKYDPKSDGPKVPFFGDGKEGCRAPKVDSPPVPRDNPRAWLFNPTESWLTTAKMTPILNASVHADINETSAEIIAENEAASSVQVDHDNTGTMKAVVCIGVPECEADEAASQEEQETDIKALLPQLRRSGYYTEPQIQELGIKEKADPGFCSRVKDFVVGHIGYGSIKFLGETDVRQLDLDSLIYINNREVTVYVDDSKKPPMGQGLNKPAEVTLLNIKCINKKTGKQYTDGPLVEKYREKLTRAAKEQGAEFVSFDPVEGEWKFRVPHFNL
ncbi:hypothetical protein NMG60_11021026 [Bertholletia excelsa]